MSYSTIGQISNLIGTIIPFLLAYFIVSFLFFTYKFFTAQSEVKAFSKKKMLFGILYIFGTLFVWVAIGLSGNVMGVGQGGSIPIPTSIATTGSINSAGFSLPNYRYDNIQQYNQRENVSDTRSFIKKTFSATLKTREVESVASKVESLVTDKEGRIDSSNISKNYASISFVIPKSELSDFKDELKTYTSAKLYTQTTSSQNLLGEKKNLERSQDATKSTKSSFEEQKKQMETEYAKNSAVLTATIASKNAQLKTTSTSLIKRENQLNTATDTILISEFASQAQELRRSKSVLINEIQSLNSQLVNLTSNYTSQITTLTANIGQQANNLASLGEQTENFLDKVETVEGYVSIENVTYLQLFDIYSPIPFGWILAMIAALFMISRIYMTFKSFKDVTASAVVQA